MTHLNIQQGLNIEVVSTNLIKKLYEAALSVPEPLEGELDAAYMSGNLLVDKSYRALVEYLTNRFDDLHINVTDSYYIPFEDSAVLNVLLANNIGSDGIGITEAEAANATLTNNTFKNNTTITSFNEFSYFTRANINPVNNLFEGCTNLEEVDLSLATKISEGEFLSSGIKEVYAPSLIEIGLAAFRNSSVETVTSLGNIVSIPFGCFMYCNDLQTVQLPSSVTTISPGAFSVLTNGVSSLTYINLNNVTSIDNSAFTNCKLLNIDASDLSNLVSIGGETFSSCFSIHGELNMPNLISAGNKCFNSCSRITKVKCLGKITTIPEFFMVKLFSSGMALTEVYLPYECTSILWNGFNGCSALTTIKQYTQSVDNWVNGEPSSYGRITRITAFGDLCFLNCSSLTITTEDIENAVTIGMSAFASSGLTGNINLPNLTSLGQYAFYASGVTGATDLGSITEIPQYCFLYSGLLSITLPSTCTTIKSRGLSDMTTLTTVNGMSNVTTIESYAFYNDTNLTSVAGLSNVTSIGEGAFYNCPITGTLNLPNLVSLGNIAFRLTNITSVLNLGLVSEIGDPFWNCPSITEIILPTTLRKSGCFYNTHVSKLIYPYGYTELTASSLCGNQQGAYLLYIQFPSTITKIVLDDMYRDSGSSRITCHVVILATTPPNTNRNPSDTERAGLGWGWGDPRNARWYVPDAVVNTYKADTQWSSIADYIFPISQLEADSPTCWAWYQANKDYGVPAQS